LHSVLPVERPRISDVASKVPPVVLTFWVIKILATTLGETGGDAVSMTLNLGYAGATLIFLAFFAIALTLQVRAERYHPFRYWAVVVATTTVGTTTSDFLDRTLGLGYVASSIALFLGVLALLFAWHRAEGRIGFEDITTRREEVFYWLTILVANTLGTALGDCVADTAGIGFEGGALLFAGLIAGVGAAHLWLKRIPASLLFWAAYVLSRPLGATVGDVLTKPHAHGGLALDRISSSLVMAACMGVGILVMTWRARPPLGASAPAGSSG
jgi:uncharacterized membrane-anchored protein